jgi:transcriptional regulator with XRE-family HTH domain
MSNIGNKEVMSENLKYYMDFYNKDRYDICDDLGIKYTTLTDWVNGNVYPRIDKIELLANYFGVQKSDLIEKHDQKVIEKDNEYESLLNDVVKNPDLKIIYNEVKELSKSDLQLIKGIIDQIKKSKQ